MPGPEPGARPPAHRLAPEAGRPDGASEHLRRRPAGQEMPCPEQHLPQRSRPSERTRRASAPHPYPYFLSTPKSTGKEVRADTPRNRITVSGARNECQGTNLLAMGICPKNVASTPVDSPCLSAFSEDP